MQKVKGQKKVHQYYARNGLIRLQIEESNHAKIIPHMVDLQNLVRDIRIDSFLSSFFPDICW